MDHNRRWLCLDCGRNTFEGNENYYFLRNRLWRKLVPREQRHGMICRACIERRVGRPLVSEDFKSATDDQSGDPKNQPMKNQGYGNLRFLTPPMAQTIGSGIIEFVGLRPRKVIA